MTKNLLHFAVIAFVVGANAQAVASAQAPKHCYLADAANLSANEVMLEIYDSSRTETGGILNCGHIAIRCMVDRNLKVLDGEAAFYGGGKMMDGRMMSFLT
jgi:hypothetical protein